MRSLDHSTIIYESPQIGLGSLASSTSTSVARIPSVTTTTNTGTPLLRISPCSKDANLLATFHLDSSTVLVLDIRQPGKELYNLVAHTGNINASILSPCEFFADLVQWAPSSRHVLVSGGDDQQALVWDLSRQSSGGRSHSGTIREPTLAYNTECEINNLYCPPPLVICAD
jgi:DDB1- and CUL4-associated factor 7